MLRHLREILDLLGPDRRKLPWLMGLFLGASILDLVGLGLIGPYVTLIANPSAIDGQLQQFIESLGLPTEFQILMVTLGILLLCVFVLKAIAAISINWAIIRFTLRLQLRLRTTLMHAYQTMPYTEFLQRNSSEYIHSIQILTMMFTNGVVAPALITLSNVIVAVAILCMLAWQNGAALATLAILLVILLYGYDHLFRRHLGHYGKRANDASTAMVRGITEGIEGLKEIRVLGKESYFFDIVRNGAEEYAHFFTRNQLIGMMPRYLLELALIGFLVLLVIVTLEFGQDQMQLIPTLAVFALAAIRLLPASTGLANSLTQLRFNSDAVFRLHRDIGRINSFQSAFPETSLSPGSDSFCSLTLQALRFTFPNMSKPALRDISIEIHAGESIGLIGTSGSGKTTLVDVILGLLRPDGGQIRYNQRPLQEALDIWRAQVAYLPQQVFLIDDTLRRNVALGVDDADIDEERIHAALTQARLSELVDQLPDGLATLLGERGVRLSGGQRQRVALARAFYHGRNVLVMDEATSALDNETENEIVEEIRRLRGQKTLIVIAHRLSTVEHCDRIYRLEEGGLVDEGTPAQILKRLSSVIP